MSAERALVIGILAIILLIVLIFGLNAVDAHAAVVR